ncbi:MAG: PilZ domain-containing protein [Spirochaetes bacterium]|nr:PilZ domain-containing protein [Spirochaetota bacterium]
MEKRGAARVSIPESRLMLKDEGVFFDIDEIRGRPVDISLKGIGVEIPDLTPQQAERLRGPGELFINLHLGDDAISAGVKKAWFVVREDGGRILFKGGLSIDVISPQDRLKLHGFIEGIRK